MAWLASTSFLGQPIGQLLWPAPASPSITTLVVLADVISSLFHRPLLKPEDRRVVYPTIAVVGVVLYATITGLAGPDLYRAGFSSDSPLVLAIGAALVARRAPRAACTAILVLVAFDLHILRSRNLFDYFFDPLVVGVSLVWCVAVIFRWLARKITGREGSEPSGGSKESRRPGSGSGSGKPHGAAAGSNEGRSESKAEHGLDLGLGNTRARGQDQGEISLESAPREGSG
jgi:hypothetical protein